jgi:hypothetical protein
LAVVEEIAVILNSGRRRSVRLDHGTEAFRLVEPGPVAASYTRTKPMESKPLERA